MVLRPCLYATYVDINKRLAITIGHLAKLNKFLRVKVNLLESLITATAFYGCETWAYNGRIQKIIMTLKCDVTWRTWL